MRCHKLDSHPPNTEANFQSARLSLFSAYVGGEMMPLTDYSAIHHALHTRVQKGGLSAGVHGVHSYNTESHYNPVN